MTSKLRQTGKRVAVVSVIFLMTPLSVFASTGFLDAELLGGQFMYRGSASSFGGIAKVTGGPAFSLSEKSSLFLTYDGNYNGFKSVSDLVGGDQLFQQSMDHTARVKYKYAVSDTWSLKPSIAYTKEFFRETKDETWGKGLYDFDRLTAGVDSEWKMELFQRPASLVASYHFFRTTYPNFRSLGSSLGQEIATNPGSRTLDTLAHQLGGGGSIQLSPAWTLSSSYDLTFRSFVDQKIINSDAQYGTNNRLDIVNGLGIGASFVPQREWTMPMLGTKLRGGMELGYHVEYLQSNQNHFDTDPSLNFFNEAFYDYLDNSISATFSAFFANKAQVSFGYNLDFRSYLKRHVQDANGQYLAPTLNQTTHILSLTASYPIAKGFSWKIAGHWQKSESNMAFERTYRYNYGAAQYFAGVGYSF